MMDILLSCVSREHISAIVGKSIWSSHDCSHDSSMCSCSMRQLTAILRDKGRRRREKECLLLGLLTVIGQRGISIGAIGEYGQVGFVGTGKHEI
jgi:hypothetical protein